jgi:hypothetical protein
MRCARAKKAAARQPDSPSARNNPYFLETWQLCRAALAAPGLFPEGTLSRVDADLLFVRIRKARKIQRLPLESLATALQLEKASKKS